MISFSQDLFLMRRHGPLEVMPGLHEEESRLWPMGRLCIP